MLLGLKQGLAAGSSFPLTLTFEKAGSVQVDVPVEAMGSMGPGGHAGMHLAMTLRRAPSYGRVHSVALGGFQARKCGSEPLSDPRFDQ